jgi:hypothetical protein
MRLERLRPAKGRWVEPRLRCPGGPALVWDPDPDRPRKLVARLYDERYQSEPEEA